MLNWHNRSLENRASQTGFSSLFHYMYKLYELYILTDSKKSQDDRINNSNDLNCDFPWCIMIFSVCMWGRRFTRQFSSLCLILYTFPKKFGSIRLHKYILFCLMLEWVSPHSILACTDPWRLEAMEIQWV